MTDPTDPLETARWTSQLRSLGGPSAHAAANHFEALAAELARVKVELARLYEKCGYKSLTKLDPIESLEYGIDALNRNLNGEIAEHQRHHDVEDKAVRSLIAQIDGDGGQAQEGETVAQSCERAGKVVAELRVELRSAEESVAEWVKGQDRE